MSLRSKKIRRHKRRTLSKKRLVVKFRSQNSHYDEVIAEVEGWGAYEWAKNEQSIGGDRWSAARDVPGYAYAWLTNNPGLVEELTKEGYQLNLSEYHEPIFSCEEAECIDPECEWKNHNEQTN